MPLKMITIVKKFSNDTGEYTHIAEVFNRIVTISDYYDILSNYRELPNWLNRTLFEKGHYINDETLEEFILDKFQMIDLGD